MTRTGVAIIGAGEAGVAAAAALRESGYEERILLIGEEPQLPYERPPLSKEILIGSETGPKLIRSPEWYADQRIEYRPGTRVTAVDADAQTIALRLHGGGEELCHYDMLLLTTGARVRELPDAGSVHYLRTIEDGERLRERLTGARSLAVVGGGVIGLEVASSAHALGLEVTVIDIASRLMGRALAPEISQLLEEIHRDAGVRILTGVGSLAFETVQGGVRITAGAETTVDADLVVAGIGVVPNDELGVMAGCRVDNGIVVDGAGRTNRENIFAAGDVASFHHPTFARPMRVEAWQHAGRHGAHVARAMLGISDDYCEVPWFWTDQHGVNIQVAGVAVDADATFWRGARNAGTAFHFAGSRLVAVTTVNNGRDIRPSTKLIAARWSGEPGALLEEGVPLGKLATKLLADMV